LIVAGFGFRSGADMTSLCDVLHLAQQGLPAVSALAAPEDKIRLLTALADILGVPVIGIAPQAVCAASPMTFSPASFAARGTGSVAEAVALAAAGPGAVLLGLRHISPDRMATCAIAQGALQ
jgi:cobalt-precorrin 5A hydrolase